MRAIVLSCVLLFAVPAAAAPSINIDWKQECFRDASVYLKLVRMVIDRKIEQKEEVSANLHAEFAQAMRTAKEWKTAVDATPRNRRGLETRRSLRKGGAKSFVVSLKRRIRTCRAMVPG
jgi:hypothetical protein